jgi:pimeloyl-ACP methyl ester carboxylesterase
MEYKKYEDIQEPLMQFLYNYSPPETLKIPVVFISGSTDVVTPVDLVQEYYERLTAPKKDIFIMQGAGHNPSAEVDSMKAYAEIIKKALAFILE